MNSRNLTLLTDLYELTMMQGYFERQENETVVFDVFFRSNPCGSGYSIAAGLEQVIDYIKDLNFSYDDVDYLRNLNMFSEDFLHYLSGFHFSGDIYAIPEGTVVFPKEPLLKLSHRSWKHSLWRQHLKYHQPSVSHCDKDSQSCLCRCRRRCDGIRSAAGARS